MRILEFARRVVRASGVAFALLAAAAASAAPLPPSLAPMFIDGGEVYRVDFDEQVLIDVTLDGLQSAFNSNRAISSTGRNGVGTGSGTWSLSEIPLVSGAFQLGFDIQEPNNRAGREIRMETIEVRIDEDLIWSLDPMVGPLVFNYPGDATRPASTETAAPNNNGADFALLVPLELVVRIGSYTGASQLRIDWSQSSGGGSEDEWVVLGGGHFLATQSVQVSREVPLPGAFGLAASGVAAILAVRRRRGGAPKAAQAVGAVAGA
jgi:hypothetical protein